MSERARIAVTRFGLGPRLDEALPGNPEAWLEAQLTRPAPAPSGPPVSQGLRLRHQQQQMERQQGAVPNDGSNPLREFVRGEMEAWADRQLATTEPYRERLVTFWMNHFTVSRRNGLAGTLVGAMERDAVRPHVTGRFADMLVAVTRHPAMLIYLDNHVSVGPDSRAGQRAGRGLNENLAREVLELHTLSPAGGYTQGDVTELAKVLTGWSVAANAEPFDFVWRPQAHQPGEKTLLGRRFRDGEDSQETVLRFLGTHPATYRHLAVKLARHFVADDPPPDAVRGIERVLRETEGDLGAASRALIHLPAAWAPPLGKLRTPKDWVIGTGRVLGVPRDRGAVLLGAMAALGQPLWMAPQPDGWSDRTADWATPEGMMRRTDWAYTFAGRFGQRLDTAEVTEAALGPFARAETVAAMRVAGSVRDALTLLLASPEFLLR
jgi:uncharacterized protein (DUF1800 family)